MEIFYLEEVNINRKEQAIEYILEHQKYNSEPSGCSALDDEYLDYEKWLKKLENFKNERTCPKGISPGIQYFLIRENDNKIVGMYNLRWNLNEWMLTYGGHIGDGIRPLERRKGYSKIGLYLCLLKAKEKGLEKVLLTVREDNIASIKSIEALGGILENKVVKEEKILMRRYWINLDESINKYSEKYLKYMK